MKTFLTNLAMITIALLLNPQTINAQCDPNEYDALRDFYYSTGGDSWNNRTGWDIQSSNPPAGCNLADFYGVTLANGRVVELNLTGNGLNGQLPESSVNGLTDLSFLKKLILENNQLNGYIPYYLSNLVELEELNLASNQLYLNQIHYPTLTNLMRLDLSNNNIQGYFEFGSQTSLTYIDLSNNVINTIIPAGLENLTSLVHLDLSNNKFFRTIPQEITAILGNLSFFNISNNGLSGCYPDNLLSFCSNFTDAEISDGNNFNTTWNSFCNIGVTPCGECHIDDWTGLKALYESTDGDSWTNRDGWDVMIAGQSSPPANCDLSTLYGVSLHNGGRVVNLNLGSFLVEGNNLTGTIPAEICNLSELEKLHLNSNNLSGNIPPQLGNLVKINILNLGDNQLTGQLPTTFENFSFHNTGSSPELSYVVLWNNSLSGCYPSSFKNLCFANEDIFNVIDIGNGFDYSFIDFCNSISSGNALGECNNGTVPLAPCDFTQPAPIHPEWPPLLELYENTDGDNWTNRSGWDVFIDSQTSPPSNYDLGNLHGITTSTNPLARGSNFVVTEIRLINNGLNGTLPPEIGDLENLTWLWISSNGNLSGEIPSEIGTLYNLEYLNLSSNQLNGTIPSEVGDLSLLNTLWLNENQLDGSIPAQIGNLSNLSNLNFFDNQLSGSIPPEIGDLNNLSRLILKSNELSGNIPADIGSLVNLEFLDLSRNQLDGTIPSELSDLSSLFSLNLSDNQLTGNIIPSDLPAVNYLFLSNNLLSGPIPGELVNLNDFESLNLSYNQLSGCYSPDLTAWCGQFNNTKISNGNSFNASFENFCNSEAGSCGSCISFLIIIINTVFQNLYQSGIKIQTQGTVTIPPNQQVEYNSKEVILNQGFSVPASSNFAINTEGCD